MAAYQDPAQDAVPHTQAIDWETPGTTRDKLPSDGHWNSSKGGRLKHVSTVISLKLERTMPSYRKYFGFTRRIFLIICALFFLAIMALAIGLGVGLSQHSGGQNLPLPSNSKTFQGDLTYYAPGLGACGISSSDNDGICAVSHIVFDAASKGSDPNSNPLCGLKLRATRFDERVNAQRSVDLKVVDRCTGCASTDIDVSPGAFKTLADPTLGRVGVAWAWLSSTPGS